MTRRPKRTCIPEQKVDAIRMAHELGNVPEVARRFDFSHSALSKWIKLISTRAKALRERIPTDERGELRRLRPRNRLLERERDFPKEAAVFFRLESDQRTG